MLRTLLRISLPFYVPVLFVIIWQCGSLWLDNPLLLPGADTVLALLAKPFESLIAIGSLAESTLISLTRVMVGYCLSIAVAVPLGIAIGNSKLLTSLFSGFLGFLRVIPPLAWVPLVLAWFGVVSLATILHIPYGPGYIYFHNIKISMVAIIFIGCFFPMLSSTIHGVRMVPAAFIDAACVLGASKRDIFRKVLLPCAAPSIVNGMRIGLGMAWMCVIAAEMLPGSLSGIGYLITYAFTVSRVDVVIAGIICIGATGAAMDFIFRVVENKKFSWKILTK